MIHRASIRQAVDVQRILDRLLDSSTDPLDAHPIQVDGEEIAWLDEMICHMVLRWLQRRGVKIE